jgi:glutaminyl-peptide cyclotransferase
MCGAEAAPAFAADAPPEYGYKIVHTYAHDPKAFTQGLFFLDGYLYESTGLKGQSSIRKVRLDTGEVLQRRPLASAYFGEGIVNWKGRLIALTYTTQVGFVFDLATFEPLQQFSYPGEGWGLTHDGKRIIMSDGTAELRFWSPDTLKETGRLKVTDRGVPVERLNELEWVRGEIYANVWQTNRIARIDPGSGKVVGWIDLTGLLSGIYRLQTDDVLNGIAYDAAGDRLFVTGKNWPRLFEIRLTPKTPKGTG